MPLIGTGCLYMIVWLLFPVAQNVMLNYQKNFPFKSPEKFLFKMVVPDLLISWTEDFWFAAFLIVICPVHWIVMTWMERRWSVFSKICGSARAACLLVAFITFILGIWRDCSYHKVVTTHRQWHWMRQNWILWSGHTIFFLGMFLVFLAFLTLGLYGSFLGEFFGITNPERQGKFPYNYLRHPMYIGSSMAFFGYALVMASQSGILLSMLVAFMYKISIMYEEPFLDAVYDFYEEEAESGESEGEDDAERKKDL